MQILCLGDVAIGDEATAGQVWAAVRRATQDGARLLFNCELPLGGTLNPVPRSSGPRLMAHPASLNGLHGLPAGIATLATNHILDAGVDGLAQTLDALHAAGFATVGAGMSREEIEKTLIWETAEGRLAVINWVFPETHPDWMAVPGPHCWPGPEAAREVVMQARAAADWVMVVAHWSDELFPYPRPEDRIIARALAGMGVDIVVGHHAHVVRGMEVIGSCPVYYSTGNFYFSDLSDCTGGLDLRPAPRNREGLGVRLTLRAGMRPQHEAVSFWQTATAVIADPARRAERSLARFSRPLQRLEGAAYAAWYLAKRARFDRWGGRWHFGARKRGLRGSALYVWNKVRS